MQRMKRNMTVPTPLDLFPLAIPGKDGREDAVVCLKVLRNLPGKRLACTARWRGEVVFAKIFTDRKRSRVHWQREARGVGALWDKGISTPAPIYSGPTNREGVFVALYEYIAGGKSVAEAWRQAPEPQRLELLQRMAGLLAQHHCAGILQHDLHLGNFLLRGDRLYTLDGDGIAAHCMPLGRKAVMENLAWLFAQLYPIYDSWVDRVLPVYAGVSPGMPGIEESVELKRLIRQKRVARKAHFLKKTFRECGAFVRRMDWDKLTLFDRSCDSDGLRRLLADPERTMNAGVPIKRGNTCTVARIAVDGKDWVVKRYNIKNWCHAFSRAWRPSRAAVSWRNAHTLLFYGIAAPKPVALIEKRWGPLRGKAYYVSEYSEGVDALSFFFDGDTGEARKTAEAERIATMLKSLKELKISHGDLKATNIRIADRGIVLIDLDSMIEHRSNTRFASAWKRDMSRFFENWRGAAEISRLFARLLGEDAESGERPLA